MIMISRQINAVASEKCTDLFLNKLVCSLKNLKALAELRKHLDGARIKDSKKSRKLAISEKKEASRV